jgi:hypothetical protein
MIYACCIFNNLILDRNGGLAATVWQNYTPHPSGYNGVLHPITQIFSGGQDARIALMEHIT